MAHSEQPSVGIDLGTTFSVVARLDETGRPQTIDNGEGEKITPSIVLIDDDGVVIGKEALKAMATEMEHIAECAKRDLGRRMFRKSIGGRQYPPEALEAWILNKLRLDTEQQVGTFQKVVITVPAYFDEVRRKATQDAGYMAGFDVMDIINEPTAAAIAFGYQQGYLSSDKTDGKRQKIMVYDLGGGTFDVTVMEIDGRDFTAIATDGDVQLGGRDWDQRLVDYVAEAFIRKHGVDPREEPNVAGRLWRECEDAKRTLSSRSRASVACEYRGHALRMEIARDTFEEITQDLLDRTEFTTRQTLQAAGLEWDNIDRILLVGGSTRIPAVREMLKQLSGKEPDRSISPDEAVAHGAALHAGLLLAQFDGRVPPFRVKNVNSHSLGVVATDTRTRQPRNATLIPRNTPLPAEAERVFVTRKANQQSILVQIVEGESASPEDCSQVGRCSVHDLPANLPAQTQISVRFRYLENGRLMVRVEVAGTGKQLDHEIVRENSLTTEQLNGWRKYISSLPPLATLVANEELM